MGVSESFAAGAEGFAFGFSLILAIGAQNAYVLRQGLLNRHVFWVCLICAASDAALIAAGVLGVGTLAASSPVAVRIAAGAGAVFLFGYGGLRLRSAARPRAMTAETGGTAESLKTAAMTTLALTWLNPHVYLDTVLLLGGISARFAGWGRGFFGLGAVAASFVFFFSLGYGARRLAPVFARPSAWRILDATVAVVMFAIGARLVVVALEGGV